MLDVHPPHEPINTWKGFALHIATIVIGLLIAVGLEQTVEYFHHRNEVREAREALAAEHEETFVATTSTFTVTCCALPTITMTSVCCAFCSPIQAHLRTSFPAS